MNWMCPIKPVPTSAALLWALTLALPALGGEFRHQEMVIDMPARPTVEEKSAGETVLMTNVSGMVYAVRRYSGPRAPVSMKQFLRQMGEVIQQNMQVWDALPAQRIQGYATSFGSTSVNAYMFVFTGPNAPAYRVAITRLRRDVPVENEADIQRYFQSFRLDTASGGTRQAQRIASAPTPAPSVTFRITSNYQYKVSVAFYSQDRAHGWPSVDKGHVIADSEPHDYELTCRVGETICYGAWPAGGDNTRWWGVGQRNSRSCPKCCTKCDGSRVEYTLK